MLKIETLTVRNFLSVGNNTQSINFGGADLTLVLGENLDQGGDDAGARNGTGKTTILNALSYALYDKPLSDIKIGNLVNKTNKKNLVVSVEFTKDDKLHRIERGYKPKFMKYYINGEEQAQGSASKTLEDIIRDTLHIPHIMFEHLVILNTYTEPFLKMKPTPQREVIELLLGITILSEKADKLMEKIRITKDELKEEEFRIKAVKETNEKIVATISNLKEKQISWADSKEQKLITLATRIDNLGNIDIETELAAHKTLEEWTEINTQINVLMAEVDKTERNIARETKIMEKAKSRHQLVDILLSDLVPLHF